MNTTKLYCPLCAGAFQAIPSATNQQVTCPWCNQLVMVPPNAPQPPISPPPAPPLAAPPQATPPDPQTSPPLQPITSPVDPRTPPPLKEITPPTETLSPQPSDQSTVELPSHLEQNTPATDPWMPPPPKQTTSASADQTSAVTPPSVTIPSEFVTTPRSDSWVPTPSEQEPQNKAAATPEELLPSPVAPDPDDASGTKRRLQSSNESEQVVYIPTTEGKFVAVHEPVKTVARGANEVQLRRLSPEQKAHRRRRRTLVTWAICVTILILTSAILYQVG